MYTDKFFSLPCFLPPLANQDAIVKFLDEKVTQIDIYISSKQKLNDLLLEQIYKLVLSAFVTKSKSWSLDWLDVTPKTWQKQKAKYIFKEIKVFNQSSEQLLAVTQDKGVLPKDMCESNFVSPSGSLAGLKLVDVNDFVISLGSFQGGIEYSPYRGIVSPAYNVIRLKEQLFSENLIRYYKYLFKTKRFIQLLNTIISGIRDGKNINFSDFANLVLPIPAESDLSKMIDVFNKYEIIKQGFEKEKKLLVEYKNSLIAKAVVGKTKVS